MKSIIKKIVLLGSTGSIGNNTLKVARQIPDKMKIIAIAANSNFESLANQSNDFNIDNICIYDENKVDKLKSKVSCNTKIYTKEDGLIAISTLKSADLIIVAMSGIAGLKPTLEAIEAGKDVAIASKEILVMAGSIIIKAAKDKGVNIIPIDSEHNAIFQCLESKKSSDISRLILTASGGPFRKTDKKYFPSITKEMALKHPTWKMGKKITIDSATLFNKGLEMIEAKWLFNVDMSKIDIVIHPQSIIHSMVEFIDGSILSQMSNNNMAFPIQYAITWPNRVPNNMPFIDFNIKSKLEFEPPRLDDFPSISLARKAGEVSETLPAVFNAANEASVDYFLKDKISFPSIWKNVAKTMDAHTPIKNANLNQIIESDNWARNYVKNLIL